jgi:hypothetical protein
MIVYMKQRVQNKLLNGRFASGCGKTPSGCRGGWRGSARALLVASRSLMGEAVLEAKIALLNYKL